jgi:hypothetical protein
MKYNLCSISESTKEKDLSISLKGKWYKYDNGFVRITIVKDLMIISSGISDRVEELDIELPTNKQFFLQVIGSNGTSNIVVSGRIRMNLEKGKSIYGICNL